MISAAMQANRSIHIDGLRRTITDLRRSMDFYCGGLGFELSRVATPSSTNMTRVRLGAQHIDLVMSDEPMGFAAAANPPDPRFQHAAIVTNDMNAVWQRLEAHRALAISRGGPQVLPARSGGVTAFKFRDPDGHPLELIQFPPGIGDPRWQRDHAAGPTLGIDHFALVVEAVEISTTFFAAQLHLRVTGRHVNHGVEQDRLDGLDGVEVDVVSLEPQQGPRTPHLELLHYRRPAFVVPVDRLHTAFESDVDQLVCLSERRRSAGPGALHLCDPDSHRFIVDI